jgi:hypothetical protein
MKTCSELAQRVIGTVVRTVARRRLVETSNPSACAMVDCNMCGLAIALHVCKCDYERL